nr:MAG TPA: hypothetical protein [Caudoviricetes sp.]
MVDNGNGRKLIFLRETIQNYFGKANRCAIINKPQFFR